MAKARKQHAVVVDQGPIERRNHNQVVVERDARNRPRLRVVDQTELDRLLWQRLITLDQHTAGDHLYGLLSNAGYFAACKWALESNIRGSVQTISDSRDTAMIKVALSTVWVRARAGLRTQQLLFAVALGERKAPDKVLPPLRFALDVYQRFESWWFGRDLDVSIPTLLSDMPGRIQSKRPRAFYYEIR